MATSTNLGLYLPTRDDYISVKRDISDNMEIIDAAVGSNTSSVSNIDSGLAYVAVKVGNNWQIPSGKTAHIGDYVIVNGVFGHATAVLTGGSTNIVENTNWVAETNGSLNNILEKIATQAVTFTKVNGTLNSSASYRIAKLIVISIDLTLSAAISAYNAVINNLPNTSGTYNIVGAVNGILTLFYVAGTSIYTRSNLSSSDNIRFTAIYFAD